MALSAVTMGFTSPAVKTGANTGKRLREGASVKDVANETKDKFVNNAKTAGKLAVTAAGISSISALTGLEVTKGIVSKHLPKSITGLVEKAANSDITKQAAEAASGMLSKAGSFVKAHPIACAGILVTGALGQLDFNHILKDGAKNEGKIEQKYDDIIKLKNSTTDILA